jgi:hypothetical protein
VAALAALSPASRVHGQQQPPIVVTVVDDISRRPLANADVIELETGRHRLTNEEGRATLNWPAHGTLRLRIREVGYKPIERTLTLGKDTTSLATTFGMSRVAYVIAPVQSQSRCVNDADSASRLLTVSVLEQLRQGAEKYQHFRRTYPFDLVIERRTAELRPHLPPKIRRERETFTSGSAETRYRPGRIVEDPDSPRFRLPILFLSNLSDPAFWENHCFVVRGFESLKDSSVVRLEFSPSSNVRGPDWEGAAFLDSATSILRRVEFRIANLRPKGGPERIEGYTTYRSPSPFVVMPDTTVGAWWLSRDRPGPASGEPDFGQMLFVYEMSYSKAKPPPIPLPTSSPPR